jgi:signal transduction histidine kinase
MSESSQIPISARIIAVLLQHRFGRVQALERALQLQGVVRFVSLTFFLIVLPSILLAYLTIASLRFQESSVQAELKQTSDNTARSFIDLVGVEFTGIEALVAYLLEAGKSPMNLLHQHQRIALRFDQENQLIAPIIDREPPEWRNDFHPQIIHSGSTKGNDTQHLIDVYSQAKVVQSQLDLVNEIDDLPNIVRPEALRQLLDDNLNAIWSLRDGLRSALAYRVLARLRQEEHLDSTMRVYIDSARIRIDEKVQMLYWSNAWELEWRKLIQTPRTTQPGALHWQVEPNAIWARTNWGDETYLFGLDKQRMIESLEEAANNNSRNDMWVSTLLLEPNAEDPEDMMTKRYLPWLEGWSVAVVQKNQVLLQEEQQQLRVQRITTVLFALGMMGIGAFLAARVVAKEIEVASIKSNFAANVSHELRSPITQIRLKGESLLFGLAITEEEKQKDISVIIRESERLTWLVENVLDYTAIERSTKQYYLKKGDIGDTVYRAVESLQVTLSMADAVIEMNITNDIPPIVHDPHAIRQCVVNLITNAIKYSGDEKWVSISLSHREDILLMMVTDRGIEIPIKDINHIFEPFFRSDDREARRQKGTGIGLSITKHIIEAHGGSISVQSVMEMGSTFTVRLPYQREGELS